MITEEIKNIKSGKNDLRKFGLTMAIALALFGGFSCWRGKEYHVYLFGLSAIFFILAFVIPSFLRPVNKVWITLAILLSWFTTRVFLIILFYIGITTIGFLSRLFGKDFLGLKFNKDTVNSYWIPKEKRRFEKSEYERQF